MADKDGHWIEKATENKGAFHRATGTPAGEDIPESKIEADEHSKNPRLAKEARLAATLEHLRPGASHHKAGAGPEVKHVAHVIGGK